jgi:hypothetical protein
VVRNVTSFPSSGTSTWCRRRRRLRQVSRRIQVTAGDPAVQELEEALQEAHLAESMELLALAVGDGVISSPCSR